MKQVFNVFKVNCVSKLKASFINLETFQIFLAKNTLLTDSVYFHYLFICIYATAFAFKAIAKDLFLLLIFFSIKFWKGRL